VSNAALPFFNIDRDIPPALLHHHPGHDRHRSGEL